MKLKENIIASIVVSIILLAVAVLVWANQTGKITIWGEGGGTVSLVVNPNFWIAEFNKTSSKSEVKTFDITTLSVDPIPTADCNMVGWKAESDSNDFKISKYGSTDYSSSVSDFILVGHNTCLPPVRPAKFSVFFDTSAHQKGTYTANITVTGTHGDSTASVIIPVKIYVVEGTDTNKKIEMNTSSASLIHPRSAVTFWNDGTVTKVSSVENPTNSVQTETSSKTCYTQEEMNSLITQVSDSGFWDTNDTVTSSMSSFGLFVSTPDKTKRLSVTETTTIPKIQALFDTIIGWPDIHNDRTFTGGICYLNSSCNYVSEPHILKSNNADPNPTYYMDWEPNYHLTLTIDPSKVNEIDLSKYVGKNVRVGGCLSVTHINTATLNVTSIIEVTPDTQAPTAPGNTKSETVGSGDVHLSWTASTDNIGVTAYNVYAKGSDNKLVFIGATTGLSYTVSGGAGCNFVVQGCRNFVIIALDTAGNRSPEALVQPGICPTCTSGGGGNGGGGTGGGTTGGGSGGGNTGLNLSKLVSTGQALWFNILIALILAAIVSYFTVRSKSN